SGGGSKEPRPGPRRCDASLVLSEAFAMRRVVVGLLVSSALLVALPSPTRAAVRFVSVTLFNDTEGPIAVRMKWSDRPEDPPVVLLPHQGFHLARPLAFPDAPFAPRLGIRFFSRPLAL